MSDTAVPKDTTLVEPRSGWRNTSPAAGTCQTNAARIEPAPKLAAARVVTQIYREALAAGHSFHHKIHACSALARVACGLAQFSWPIGLVSHGTVSRGRSARHGDQKRTVPGWRSQRSVRHHFGSTPNLAVRARAHTGRPEGDLM